MNFGGLFPVEIHSTTVSFALMVLQFLKTKNGSIFVIFVDGFGSLNIQIDTVFS